jgi:hypothetical protein
MFHPEFRYLIEQDNMGIDDNMNANIGVVNNYSHISSAIIVVGVNAFLILSFMYGLYESCSMLFSSISEVVISFWRSLSPGCEWIEIIVMTGCAIGCLIISIFMIVVMNMIGESIEKEYNKKEDAIKMLQVKDLENEDEIKSLNVKIDELKLLNASQKKWIGKLEKTLNRNWDAR